MNVVVICPEPVGVIMSGIGIRMVSLASVLHRHMEVTLLVPEGSGELALPFTVKTFQRDRLGREVGQADAALVQGEPANFLLSQRQDLFTVVDLYDPYMIEALAYGEEAHHFAYESLKLQLARGHLFLCASEEQRLFYGGALYRSGRLNPELYSVNHRLDPLILTLPFGVPEEDPPETEGYLTSRLQLPEGEPLVFFGGIYDWYDTDTLLAVWREVVRQRRAHLVVCRHPRPDSTPQSTFQRFSAAAGCQGLLDDTVHVVDWIPYGERVSAYGDCDLALSFHYDSFETVLSFRTRVLDFLWAGLPVLSSPGGGIHRRLEDLPGLTLFKENTVQVCADAVLEALASPPSREERGTISTGIRNRLSWARTSRPLVERLKAVLRSREDGKEGWWRRFRA